MDHEDQTLESDSGSTFYPFQGNSAGLSMMADCGEKPIHKTINTSKKVPGFVRFHLDHSSFPVIAVMSFPEPGM